MLAPATITHNPAATTTLIVVGAVLIAIIAVFTVGAWVVVALGRANRAVRDFNVTPDEEAVGTLRQEQLVADETPGPDAAVTARLEKVPTPEDETEAVRRSG